MFEALEGRQLFSLLGVVPAYPQISTDQTGTVDYTYDPSTSVGSFDLSSSPFSYQDSASSDQVFIFTPSSFELHFKTDASGNVLGGVAGADFEITGSVDLDGNFSIDPGEPSGVLLTGEIQEFGYQDVGPVDAYDFRLSVTGGQLASRFDGKDIGIVMNSENSTFNGDFTQNFHGDVKATAGPIDQNTTGSDDTTGITLVKKTNNTDNDTGTGPFVPVGGSVTWSYDVTNTGTVALANVVVTDDNGTPGNTADDFTVGTIASLAPQATTTLTYAGTAATGQYGNVGTATGTPVDKNGQTIPTLPPPVATNPDHYFGYTTNIGIVKLTNGTDNDAAPGVLVPVGSAVTWTYNVTTTGNVPLSSVGVTDSVSGVTPTPVVSGGFNAGDANHDSLLEAGETWVFTASGVAVAGQYTNIGTATGTPSTPAGTPISGATTQTASNSDNYFGSAPAVKIVKLTNGTDNDSPTGPYVPVGSTVTWTYVVTNPGNVPLKNVAVTDNQAGVTPAFQSGDTNSNGLLDTTETWTYTATGIAVAGQYTNIGTVNGKDALNTPVSSTNPDNYFGYTTNIAIVKLTNGTDNDAAPGLYVPVGSAVTWTYNVTTTGSAPLASVTVTDNKAGVTPTPVVSGGFNTGDTNHDNLLQAGETWVFTASGIAVAGQYTNIGTATGTPSTPAGTPIPGATKPTATNPDNYFGYTTNIGIVKLTNGTDNDAAPGLYVPVGSAVTWTYNVTTTGSVPLSSVTVTDNKTGVTPAAVVSGGFNTGDTNHDNLLQAGETWVFTASGIAVAGQYTNIGTATGTPSTTAGTPIVGATKPTATNPDNYFGYTSGIKIIKLTNGTDNDTGTGPNVPVGSTVTWTYKVSNTGSVALKTIAVTDDQGVTPVYQSGDTNSNGQLDLTETWIYSATGVAQAGQYTNVGTATGKDIANQPVTSSNVDHYFGVLPPTGIDIEKFVKVAPQAPDGGGCTPDYWKDCWDYYCNYKCTDQFNSCFSVSDSKGTGGKSYCLRDGLRDTGTDSWSCLRREACAAIVNANCSWVNFSMTAAQVIAKVQACYSSGDANYLASCVKEIRSCNSRAYCKPNMPNPMPPPATDIGDDADTAPGVTAKAGDKVVYTYVVKNTGTVPISNVVVTDDNETPGNTADDYHPTFVGGDTNNNGKLDVGETWTYTSMTTASAGLHTNIGSVVGKPMDTSGYNYPTVTDADAANYTVAVNAGIHLDKFVYGDTATSTSNPTSCYGGYSYGNDTSYCTNSYFSDRYGCDFGSIFGSGSNSWCDTSTSSAGPQLKVGGKVTFAYVVTNNGAVPLSNVTLIDDNGTGTYTGGIVPTAVTVNGYNVGDRNHDNKLDRGEFWVFKYQDIVKTGTQTNKAKATGTPVNSSGTRIAPDVSDEDSATYVGIAPPASGSATLEDDPTNPGKKMLVVRGTEGNDCIQVTRGMKVTINGQSKGDFSTASISRLVVYALGGDDCVWLADSYTGRGDSDSCVINRISTVPTWIYGGTGDDLLVGGNAGGVIVGGDGDDIILGGSGRDVLIGGHGGDAIAGNVGDDILVAGYTSYDANDTALSGILKEWSRTDRAYLDRINDLKGTTTGLNGTYRLITDGTTQTVFDDGAADEVDLLAGMAGEDWFLYNTGADGGSKDIVLDASSSEVKSDIDMT